MSRETQLQYFLKRADVKSPDECWEWKGPIDASLGYGRTSFIGSPMPAYRVAYILAKGDIPKLVNGRKVLVRHLCNNKICVNPNHLELGTYSDNGKDAAREGIHVMLNIEDLKKVIKMKKSGLKPFQIAKLFNTTSSTIRNAIAGRGYAYGRLLNMIPENERSY